MKAKVPSPDSAARAARFAVALFAVALGACAAGSGDAATGFDRPEWRACDRDTQCTATFLSCHGWEVVRADRETEVHAWYDRTYADILSRSECAGPGDTPRPAAICRTDRCAPLLPDPHPTAADHSPQSAPKGTP